MKLLTITSQKGGVGKTTVSINLAYSMARRGFRTLLVDTDPQGGVGFSLSRKARRCGGYFEALESAGTDPSPLILQTRLPELRIMPAGRAHDPLAPADAGEGDKIRDLFGRLDSGDLDLIILDTPAGLGVATLEWLKLTDSVLIPQQAEPLGVRSLPSMLKALARLKDHGASFDVIGIVLTMLQEGKESRQVARDLEEMLPEDLLLPVRIPRRPVFLQASESGIPLGLLRKNVPGEALLFDQIAVEIEQRMNLQSIDKKDAVTELVD